MKIILYISLAVSLLFTSILSAQDFAGIATYKSQRKMEIKLDSTQFSDEMRNQMMAMMKKQFEKEYTLTFNKDESIYKEVEQLDTPSGSGSGFEVQIVFAGSGGADVLYKNVKENRFANQNELFSKIFLIKDKIEPREWVLEKETKNIGEYTCFKAVFKRMVPKPRVMINSTDGDNEAEESNEEIEDELVEQVITAWYTPQIPVKHGPGNYGGLPGLILEVSDGSETVLCSKIILNPKNGVTIKEPTKGKEVTQKKYDEIMEKKMKEMEEQYNSQSGRRGGNNMEIRIGG